MNFQVFKESSVATQGDLNLWILCTYSWYILVQVSSLCYNDRFESCVLTASAFWCRWPLSVTLTGLNTVYLQLVHSGTGVQSLLHWQFKYCVLTAGAFWYRCPVSVTMTGLNPVCLQLVHSGTGDHFLLHWQVWIVCTYSWCMPAHLTTLRYIDMLRFLLPCNTHCICMCTVPKYRAAVDYTPRLRAPRNLARCTANSDTREAVANHSPGSATANSHLGTTST